MKMIIHKTNVRLPNAPIVRPIIEINRFNVGHDLANLNTRSYIRINVYIESVGNGCDIFRFFFDYIKKEEKEVKK